MPHPSSRCCTEFARAGRGLPAIEPGMPAPAGTGLTRRSFVSRAVGGALAVYGASRLPLGAFEEGIAHAAGSGERVLVNVFMSGGVDSLSVLAPVGDPRYAQLRSTLALAPGSGQAFSEDARLMWNPAVEGLRTLHGEGKVTVLPGIGCSSPDQSHFTSRHFWEVGALDPGAAAGWLGRWLDRDGSPDNPLQGVSLDGALSPVLAGKVNPTAAVPDPGGFTLWSFGVEWPVHDPMLAAIAELGALPTDDPALRQARGVATQVDRVRQDLAPLQGAVKPPVAYPTGEFGRRLSGLAAMLGLGLPVRAATVSAPGGYDTHAEQAASLNRDLKATFDGLLAFQRDLEARGVADRVLIQVWSEFGRRPQQNANGTDHGAAGIGFLIGTRASGRQVGEFPGLAELDGHGNLRATSDFRAVYCALLEQWLGADADGIVPGAPGFARPTLVRA